MKTYQSEIQPDYSVAWYSKKDYGESGAGFYLFKTSTKESLDPLEMLSIGATVETVMELRSKGHFNAFGTKFIPNIKEVKII